MSTILAIGTSEVVKMLHTKVSSAIVLPDGALTTENEADRPTFNSLKGVGMNLVALPSEALHLLQDGVIVELRAHEHHTLHVISKQQIKNEQMTLLLDSAITIMTEVTTQNKQIIQVVKEACQMVSKLAIPKEELLEVHVREMATRVHNVHTEMARV